MRVLVVLNYYSPNVSGLTNMARDLSEGLVSKGHSVTVLTSRFEAALEKSEDLSGVHIERLWTPLTFGRAAVTPGMAIRLRRVQRDFDVVHLHLPLPEAAVLAAVVPRNKLVVTYHCDAGVTGLASGVVRSALDATHRYAIRRARLVFVTSEDYAENSRLNAVLQDVRELPPPCRGYPSGQPCFRLTESLQVGFLGRMTFEKGLRQLLDAFLTIRDPQARLLLAGPYENVAGGSVIRELQPLMERDSRVILLGPVDEEELSNFFASIDVLALPSIDPLEAFGIVQVEAMLSGVRAVASQRPGVRVPIEKTGLGLLVDPNAPEALGKALVETAGLTPPSSAEVAEVERLFGLQAVVSRYESALREM